MFQEIPASSKSFSQRKLIQGVAVNNAPYYVQPLINGKVERCPYYAKWVHIIERCYSEEFKERNTTYKGCTVCGEWLVFSSFKEWMTKQDWKGKEIDKDILIQGNKIYSPSTCLFVTKKINLLLGHNKAMRGEYPIGVSLFKRDNNFKAQCKVDGRQRHIGLYDTVKEAHDAYKEFKYKLIKEVALLQNEPLRSALLNYVIL